MAIDLKDVLIEVQKQAYAADSSQDTLDLFYLLKSAVRADQNPFKEVNTNLDLIAIPVLDRSPTMYYSKENKNLYFSKDNEWRALKKYIPDWYGTNGLFAYGGGTATNIDTIDYGSFATDTSPFTDIGSMSETKSYMSAARDYSSKDASYIIGGFAGGAKSTIEKHANSTSSTSGSSVGNLSVTSYRNSTVASTTDAYTHLSNTPPNPTVVSAIDKFAFGSTVTGVEVGDMLVASPTNLGVTDAVNQKGYFRRFSSTGIELEVFPFSSGVPFTTSLVSPYGATLPVGLATAAFSNPTQGYIGVNNLMERFNFGNDASVAYGNPTAPATTRLDDVGAGSASETKGYLTGQVASPAGNAIISLPFANDADTGVMTPGVFSPSPANPGASSGGSHF